MGKIRGSLEAGWQLHLIAPSLPAQEVGDANDGRGQFPEGNSTYEVRLLTDSNDPIGQIFQQWKA
jgi:hypothetical protein